MPDSSVAYRFVAAERFINALFGRLLIGNESVPKIVINDTTKSFLNCNQHFADFKPQEFPSAV